MLPGTSGAAANHRGDLVAVADGADAGEVTRALNVNADVLTSENDTGPDDGGGATADVEYYDNPPDDDSACSHAALADEASRKRADPPAS